MAVSANKARKLDRSRLGTHDGLEPGTNSAAMIYEMLCALNEHCAATANALILLRKQGAIRKTECDYYRSLLDEVRASASQIVAEHMSQLESTQAAEIGRKRRRLERYLHGEEPTRKD